MCLLFKVYIGPSVLLHHLLVFGPLPSPIPAKDLRNLHQSPPNSLLATNLPVTHRERISVTKGGLSQLLSFSQITYLHGHPLIFLSNQFQRKRCLSVHPLVSDHSLPCPFPASRISVECLFPISSTPPSPPLCWVL